MSLGSRMRETSIPALKGDDQVLEECGQGSQRYIEEPGIPTDPVSIATINSNNME